MSLTDITVAARRLAIGLPERSAEIEAARRLPADIVAALREAGVFGMAVSKSRGGPELTPSQMCEVVEIVARGDGAVGWCAGIGMDAGIYAAYLRRAAADELFPRIDMATAGWVFPAGRAERFEGGWRVTGRWQFGSGITHADLVVCGCSEYADGAPVPAEGDLPAWRIAIVPAGKVTVLDTWHTTGLRGTGSQDYEVDGVFVPDRHTFSFYSKRLEAGPLYARTDTFLRKMAGVPLGIAGAALEFATGFLSKKIEMPQGRPAAANPRIQAAIGRAEALVGASRAYVYKTLDDDWDTLLAGEPVPLGTAALARQFAFESCQEAVQLLYDTVGSTSIYSGRTPLDQALRDLITARQHVAAQERMREFVGELRLGGTPIFPFL